MGVKRTKTETNHETALSFEVLSSVMVYFEVR
jgi:hypothetical protein